MLIQTRNISRYTIGKILGIQDTNEKKKHLEFAVKIQRSTHMYSDFVAMFLQSHTTLSIQFVVDLLL